MSKINHCRDVIGGTVKHTITGPTPEVEREIERLFYAYPRQGFNTNVIKVEDGEHLTAIVKHAAKACN